MTGDSAVVRAVSRLRSAASVSALTGAGISAASGVPTFRDSSGLWNRYRPEDIATPEAFRKDPALVWAWYRWRREAILRCRPNPGHRILAAWSRRFERFRLVTQNVDGLHEAAGSPDVVGFHGSIWNVRCVRSCPASPTEWTDRSPDLGSTPPRCSYCGDLVRPAVVWFGEIIPEQVLQRALEATSAEIFLLVGTSALVYPAAGIADAASRRGAYVIEINTERTPMSDHVDLSLRGPAAETLAKIDRLLQYPRHGSC